MGFLQNLYSRVYWETYYEKMLGRFTSKDGKRRRVLRTLPYVGRQALSKIHENTVVRIDWPTCEQRAGDFPHSSTFSKIVDLAYMLHMMHHVRNNQQPTKRPILQNIMHEYIQSIF